MAGKVAMRAVGLAVLVLAVVPACGGGEPDDGARSGSRLKLTRWEFADGANTWSGFYDAQREEECSLTTWADGNIYCTPTGAYGVVYLDAQCTQPVAMQYVDPSCASPAAPAYLLAYDGDACNPQPTHLYTAGPQQVVNSYYALDGGSCTGPFVSSGTNLYFGPRAEVPASALVELSVGSARGAAAFAMQYVTSSDGARFPWQVHDRAAGLACTPATLTPNPRVALCAPTAYWYATGYHDAACTEQEMGIAASCAGWQYAEGLAPPDACPTDEPQFFAVGHAESAPPLYELGSACVAAPVDLTLNYFALDTRLALTTFARAPDTTPGHRIQHIHTTPPDHSVSVRDASLWDSQLDIECSVSNVLDGFTRCVPTAGYIQTFYRDASCTQAVDIVQLQSGGACPVSSSAPPYALKYVDTSPGACTTYRLEVHTVMAPYAGMLYVQGGTCEPSPVTGTVAYVVGPVVDPATFAIATSATDP